MEPIRQLHEVKLYFTGNQYRIINIYEINYKIPCKTNEFDFNPCLLQIIIE